MGKILLAFAIILMFLVGPALAVLFRAAHEEEKRRATRRETKR